MKIKNIYTKEGNDTIEREVFETLHMNKNLLIERIVTHQPYETPGDWYDQEKDEWILLLQGKAEIEFYERESIVIKAGDYFFISAHERHRIKRTSEIPKCIWLAIHGNLK